MEMVRISMDLNVLIYVISSFWIPIGKFVLSNIDAPIVGVLLIK